MTLTEIAERLKTIQLAKLEICTALHGLAAEEIKLNGLILDSVKGFIQ